MVMILQLCEVPLLYYNFAFSVITGAPWIRGGAACALDVLLGSPAVL